MSWQKELKEINGERIKCLPQRANIKIFTEALLVLPMVSSKASVYVCLLKKTNNNHKMRQSCVKYEHKPDDKHISWLKHVFFNKNVNTRDGNQEPAY